MKRDKNLESELAAYRDLPPAQQLDEGALQTMADYERIDREVRDLVTHMKAEAARRLGHRLTNEFHQMVEGQAQTPIAPNRWGPLGGFSKSAVQMAGVGLGILLLAALTLLFSIPGTDEMTVASTATVSAIGGIPNSSLEGAEPSETMQPSSVMTVTPSITITFASDPHWYLSYKRLAERFQERYPDVRVVVTFLEQFTNLPGSTDAYFDSARQLATNADTFAFWAFDQTIVSQRVMDLTPFITNDPDIALEDFYPQSLQPYQWDNRTWALASAVTPTLLFYNRSLFDQAGLAYPSADWTREQFLAAAQQLTGQIEKGRPRYGFVDQKNQLAPTFFYQVANIAAQNGEGLTSAPVIEQLNWYTDLILMHKVMPNPFAEQNLPQRVTGSRIRSSEVAMWLDFLGSIDPSDPSMARQQSIDFVAVPDTIGGSMTAWQPGYFMSKYTRHPDASWLWLKFLTEYPISTDLNNPAVPARRSTAEQSGYWSQWSTTQRDAIEYALARPNILPSPDSQAAWMGRVIVKAAAEVLSGARVDDALAATLLSPVTNGTISGDAPIIGRATHESFDRYELFYKKEADGDDAYVYFGGGAEPVELGQLGLWKTGDLEQGSYTLRMRVVRTTGDYADYSVHNVRLTASQPPRSEQFSQFAHGIAADLTGSALPETVYDAVADLGFTWVKHDLRWETYQPGENIRPSFGRLRSGLAYAQTADINVLLSVSGSPDWARASGANAASDSPPVDAKLYANFLGELAVAVCQTSVKAIEVWDEQNMSYAWGDRSPDPQAYFELLRAAHDAIETACPSMLVISGGLTPAGQNLPQAVDNLGYMDQLLTLGLTEHVDGIGVHLPGYNVPPSADVETACAAITADKASFRGPCDSPHHSWSFRSTLDAYRALLAQHDVADQRLWVTEFGWPSGTPVNSNYSYGSDNSRAEQAQWTLEAFALMEQVSEVGPAFLSNLNASIVAPNTVAAPWSIWDVAGEPLPVYERLRERR